MLLIINKYLNDVTKTEDGFFVGYIDSAESYNQFLTALKDAGFYFSVRDSERFKEDGQFLFKCNKSNVPVPFSGSPFRREKNITYQCAYGSQYYGKAKKQELSHTTLDKCPKKCLRVRHSKKLGCKAKMAAKCIRIYLDYKISSESAHWRLKKEVIGKLKQDLITRYFEVKSLSRYFVKISAADQHCHSPMHPRGVVRRLVEAAKCSSVEGTTEGACFTEGDREANIGVQLVLGSVSGAGKELEEQDLRRKDTGVINLHHDQDQLRDLLAVLTKVTGRVNEGESQLSEDVCSDSERVVPNDPMVVDEQLFPNDLYQSVVVESDESLEIQRPRVAMLEKCIYLEAKKDIHLNGETQKLLVPRKEERYQEGSEKNLGKTSQSKTLSKISIIPDKVTSLKKRINSGVIENTYSLELLQSNECEEHNVIFYVLA